MLRSRLHGRMEEMRVRMTKSPVGGRAATDLVFSRLAMQCNCTWTSQIDSLFPLSESMIYSKYHAEPLSFPPFFFFFFFNTWRCYGSYSHYDTRLFCLKSKEKLSSYRTTDIRQDSGKCHSRLGPSASLHKLGRHN